MKTEPTPKFAIIQLGHAILGYGDTLDIAYTMAKSYFPELRPLPEIPVYRAGSQMMDDAVCTGDSDVIEQYLYV